MRGLKHFLNNPCNSFTGRIFYRCVDWNEVLLLHWTRIGVASFTDAWIETIRIYFKFWRNCRIFYRCVDWNLQTSIKNKTSVSRIFYRCVDWNKLPSERTPASLVASFTDAWIETSGGDFNEPMPRSHLLQMRGLKPEKPSLNLRACLVASFTDAWIETVRTWERRMKNEVASFTDAWIETVNAF